MPEITPSDAPSPKAVLGTDLANYYVLRVDATGHLQVHVLTSGLPVGAATAAAQALALAQLQLIEDMRDALQSVATDRLIVRGEDQLHSFAGVLAVSATGAVSGAGGYKDSPPCTAGQIWHVTNISGIDATTATTAVHMELDHDGTQYIFHYEAKVAALGEPWIWHGDLWLDPSDFVRIWFIGSLGGDNIIVRLTGEIMTLEV